EEPWAIPDACTPVALKRATDGGAPRLATSISAYYDDDFLTVLFDADDEEVVATYLNHDDPLWQEDVVEIFIAPEGLTPYFEIEVNPLGTTFDARIDSPDGVRATMTTDLAWTCDGLFAALRRDDGKRIQIVIRIPFAALKKSDEWRANFFRIDRSASHGDDFSAWQPTMKTPPDFHVAAAFGALRFARDKSS
ncbi:MAG TPA: carbohydrate-binding family 9-like protein, partial [Thermoanaerobaculia bacterium]